MTSSDITSRLDKVKARHRAAQVAYDNALLLKARAEERLELVSEEIEEQGWHPGSLDEIIEESERDLEERLSELEGKLK